MSEEGKIMEDDLFIREFNSEFFEDILKEPGKYFDGVNDPEDFQNYIKTLTKIVKEKKKTKKEKIWHCIFETLIQENYEMEKEEEVNFLETRVKNNSDIEVLQNMIYNFYKDPYFFSFDLAQKINYNLSRLGDRQEFCFNTDDYNSLIELEDYIEWIHIGRQEYGKEKSIYENLQSDLKRLKEKYKENPEPKVYFSEITKKDVISVENNYMELNISYIGNEKFRDYLCGKTKKDGLPTLRMILELIKKLNNTNVDMQYIWEKMTGLNAVYIVGKYICNIFEYDPILSEIPNQKQKEIVENWIEQEHELFCFIKNMPNCLTKLLLLKQVFAYVEEKKDQNSRNQLLKIFLEELKKICYTYYNKQKVICAFSVLLRWELAQPQEREIDKWQEELEEEYPQSVFEELYLSSSMNRNVEMVNELVCTNPHLPKYKMLYNKFVSEIGGKDITELSKSGNVEMVFKLLKENEILEFLSENRHVKDSKKLATEMKNAGYIMIDKLVIEEDENEDHYKDEHLWKYKQKKFSKEEYDHICIAVDEEDDIEVEILRDEEDHLKIANVKNAVKIIEDFEMEFVEEKDEKEYIEVMANEMKPYLLSDYYYIMFESMGDIEENNKLNKIVNLLLYHFI